LPESSLELGGKFLDEWCRQTMRSRIELIIREWPPWR